MEPDIAREKPCSERQRQPPVTISDTDQTRAILTAASAEFKVRLVML